MKLHTLVRVIIVLASVICSSLVTAQTKVVVIPLYDARTVFTGVGMTGNTRCSEYVAGDVGAWVEVSPCSSVSPSTIRGQDAELLVGAEPTPRYAINGNGTVSDNLTGLIWLQNGFCAQTTGNWPTALGYVVELNTSGTINGNNCGDSSDNGSFQTDWRLPNVKELQTLQHYGFLSSSGPFVSNENGDAQYANNDPFIGLQIDEAYWSSTSYGFLVDDDPKYAALGTTDPKYVVVGSEIRLLDDAMRVNFGDGSTDWTGKGKSPGVGGALQHIWAVRAGN
jgi:hypothetical protein